MYSYLPEEPTTEISRESSSVHYIFEPTHPKEVLVPAEQNEKVKEEEDVEEEEVVDETRVKDGSEEEREMKTETEVPGLLLRPGIRRSESLNVKFSFLNVREEEVRGGGPHEEGEVAESVEKRRPATVREVSRGRRRKIPAGFLSVPFSSGRLITSNASAFFPPMMQERSSLFWED
ncbi:hypothetical protein MLD38_027393 [Melastoma candidum]|uniref:Uncharacterized protein n=1 Tax=Melastoma candidum TaxID=119954 RepID=A0ACB9P4W1_9MYRT|nr:hypothetical protein MLD38_027393 [Melastoma candidum]